VLHLYTWSMGLGLGGLALMGGGTIASLLIAGGAVEWPGLHGQRWPGLEAWALLGAVPLAGAAAGAWCLWRQRRTAFVVVLAVTALAFVVPLAAGGSTALNAFRAPRPLVVQAGALERQRDIRIGSYNLEFLPSLNFYVQRNVQYVEDRVKALEFLAQPLPAYLFLPRAEWEQFRAYGPLPYRVVAAHREMYRVGEVVVVTNR
jgi:hypothetical protein